MRQNEYLVSTCKCWLRYRRERSSQRFPKKLRPPMRLDLPQKYRDKGESAQLPPEDDQQPAPAAGGPREALRAEGPVRPGLAEVDRCVDG